MSVPSRPSGLDQVSLCRKPFMIMGPAQTLPTPCPGFLCLFHSAGYYLPHWRVGVGGRCVALLSLLLGGTQQQPKDQTHMTK